MPTLSPQHVIMPCPTCGKRIAVDAQPAEGETFTCPHCEDEFAVRYRGRTSDATDARDERDERPAKTPQPQTQKPSTPALPDKNGPEQEIMTLRPALFRSSPLAYAGLWLAVLGGIGFAGLAIFKWGGSYLWLPGAVVATAGAVSLGVWKLRTMHSWVRITSKRIIDSDGFFRKTTSEILHRDIRNVRVEQSLLERITNAGTLSIYTSSDEVPEVHMDHVPRPDKVRAVIDSYRVM